MKLRLNILALCCVTFFTQSCVKDLQEELNDGKWNHERQVLDLKFENQIGQPTIETVDASTGTIEVSINVDAVPNLSSIKIASLQLSYKATASAAVGDALNFENETRSATITVQAATGEQREYTIHVNEFIEEVTGTWAVENLVLYGGTGPEYGGGAVMSLSAKSWCWNTSTGPNAECDNTITLTLEGATDDGNTYGKCINDAGPDGKYFDALYIGNNPETGENVDLSKFYRKIPIGESTWERDYSSGTITFTDKDGNQTTGSFVGAGTEDLGNSKSYTVTDHAFAFSLSGTDDWTNIYSDYDKFVKRPRKFWVTITKQ